MNKDIVDWMNKFDLENYGIDYETCMSMHKEAQKAIVNRIITILSDGAIGTNYCIYDKNVLNIVKGLT